MEDGLRTEELVGSEKILGPEADDAHQLFDIGMMSLFVLVLQAFLLQLAYGVIGFFPGLDPQTFIWRRFTEYAFYGLNFDYLLICLFFLNHIKLEQRTYGSPIVNIDKSGILTSRISMTGSNQRTCEQMQSLAIL